MPRQFVVGLFHSKGIAEDACNRLKTEGVSADSITLMMLRARAPSSAVIASELAALTVDPMVVGDVQATYAPTIRNGETAVFVRTHDEDEVDLAVDTIRLYAPLKVRVVTADRGTVLGRDIG